MRRDYLICILVILLAIAIAAGVAHADGPVIWKMHCPAHYDVVQIPANDWGGVNVMCVRAAIVEDR